MKILFVLALIFLTFSVQASNGSGRDIGNGGGAIVCRDSQSNVTYAQVYDIWEYRALADNEQNNLSADELIQRAVTRAAKLNPWFHKLLVAELATVSQGIQQQLASDEGIALNVVLDSKHITMPLRCPNDSTRRPQYEQVVNYLNDGRILVDTEIYQALSPKSLAAIHLHEAIYKILRDVRGDADSSEARRLNAYLLSSCPDETLIANMQEVLENSKLSVPTIVKQELDSEIFAAVKNSDFELAFFLFSRNINLYGETRGPSLAATSFARNELLNLLQSKIQSNDYDGLRELFARKNAALPLVDGVLLGKAFSFVATSYISFLRPHQVCAPRPDRRNEVTCETERNHTEKKKLLAMAKFLTSAPSNKMEFPSFWIELPKNAMDADAITPLMFAALTGDSELTNYFLHSTIESNHPEFLNYTATLDGKQQSARGFAHKYASFFERWRLGKLFKSYGIAQ